jgi:uncharacterized protein Yka (UPF0111/DUF47 family)
MVAKTQILEELGERAILLPTLIEEGLAANDRIKIRLSLLQEAAAQASRPGQRPPSMERELKSVGLTDPVFSTTVSGARLIDADTFYAPGAERLAADMAGDLKAMMAPIETAEAEDATKLKARLDAIVKALPSFKGDCVAHTELTSLASARAGGEDSLHRLVMDLHRVLNHVAAATAVEDIDGARVHGLNDEDRDRVRAFMKGLNRTAKLAFGHPGLATTAGRIGSRLTIQNDIGETDAHVLVVRLEGLTATTTYTDVHRARSEFFMSLFADETVAWSSLAENRREALAKGDVFYLLNGVYQARDAADLDRFLTILGSRIVFLIDWNKARKALQLFVSKTAAIELLKGAAEREEGHRAFLELGGADLVFDAVRRGGDGLIAYGEPLSKALGESECVAFLRDVLHITSDGLKSGRSTRFIRDEIQAGLAQRLQTAEDEALAVVLRHLGLTRMLAGMIATTFEPGGLPTMAERKSLAGRAKQIESKADRLTVAAREILARVRGAEELVSLADQVENATDCFDEAAFLVSLVPENKSADSMGASLADLAAIARDCAAKLVRAVEATRQLPEGKRADAAFVLEMLDAVLDSERDADTAERAAVGAILSAPASQAGEGAASCADARLLVLGSEIAHTLEEATDRMAHAAISLRNRILQGLSA